MSEKEKISGEAVEKEEKTAVETVSEASAASQSSIIKDDDIETTSIDELVRSVEKPKKTASEKAEAAKEKKTSAKNRKTGKKSFWKKHKGLIILLILLIVGAVIFMAKKKAKEVEAALASAADTEYALIERQSLSDTIATTGTIVSPKTSQLISAFRESTRITNVYYEVGDHVNEGDVVVTYSTENIEKSISNAEEDIALSRKKAALDAENRERNYVNSFGNEASSLQSRTEAVDQRLKALYEACDAYGDAKRALEAHKNGEEEECNQSESYHQQQVSNAYQQEQNAQVAYNDAVTALADANRSTVNNLATAEYTKASGELSAGDSTRQLERQLETYQDSLDDYIVTAPISGIVTKVDVEEGNGFTNGNVMTIQRDDVLYITTEINEYDIPKVEENQKVIIKTDATGDDELEGFVIEIAPVATSSSASASASTTGAAVTYTVKIEIKDKDERLRLGMSAKINIITEQADDILAVRYDAIEEAEDGSHYIRVVDNNGVGTSKDSESKGSISVVGVDGEPTGAPNDTNSDVKGKKFGAKNKAAQIPEVQTRNIPVEIGIEGDYYVQIISDEISEGMQVVVSSDFSDEVFDPFSMMMGPND